jgi:hypothetical protein
MAGLHPLLTLPGSGTSRTADIQKIVGCNAFCIAPLSIRPLSRWRNAKGIAPYGLLVHLFMLSGT